MYDLYRQLEALKESDYYPFHMPGHKRNMYSNPLESMFGIDITEIDGFDNLHHPQDILANAQKKAALLWKAKQSYFLVNGSTCGLLTALTACLKRDETILIARNCHKAVYNAIMLRELDSVYLYPQQTIEGINGSISPKQLKEALAKNPKIRAVVVTSPTFDGVVSDIQELAGIVHEKDILLIVDEAHGAHFGFHETFPKSAVNSGADIVVQSLHKTLPAMTQTAILHVCTDRVNRKEIEKYLAIYQTSSPSYVFMATMEQCIETMAIKGGKELEILSNRIDAFLEKTARLSHLKVLSQKWASKQKAFAFDKGKIIISTDGTAISGKGLYKILLEKYHIQMEMAGENYVLGIATIMDTEEGFLRLSNALLSIDEEIVDTKQKKDILFTNYYPTKKMKISQAEELPKESCKLTDSIGEISGEYIYLYPPGIPLIVPGELITASFLDEIQRYIKQGLPLMGTKDISVQNIDIISLNRLTKNI